MKPSPAKIQINNPCSENWDTMKVNDIGRFCSSCAKSVIDFTVKSDSEIQAYLKQHQGEELCGRFYKKQVDRIRIEFDENILYTSIPFWQKFLVIVLVCFGQDFFGYDFCFAQEQDSIPLKVEQVDTVSTEQDSILEVVTNEIDTILPKFEEPSLETTCVWTPFLGGLTVSGSITTVFDDPTIDSENDLALLFKETDSVLEDSEETKVERDFSKQVPRPKTPKKNPEPTSALIADTGERRQRKR